MSYSHPLAPAILPSCQLYPNQAPAIFQSFLDINLAQAWNNVEVVDLPECSCVVFAGSPKAGAPQSFVLPMSLTTPTSLAEFARVFAALSSRYPSAFPLSPSTSSSEPPALAESSSAPPTEGAATPSAAEGEEASIPTIYLSIVEKDSSVVYYVLRRGVVSPKEVPE